MNSIIPMQFILLSTNESESCQILKAVITVDGKAIMTAKGTPRLRIFKVEKPLNVWGWKKNRSAPSCYKK